MSSPFSTLNFNLILILEMTLLRLHWTLNEESVITREFFYFQFCSPLSHGKLFFSCVETPFLRNKNLCLIFIRENVHFFSTSLSLHFSLLHNTKQNTQNTLWCDMLRIFYNFYCRFSFEETSLQVFIFIFFLLPLHLNINNSDFYMLRTEFCRRKNLN